MAVENKRFYNRRDTSTNWATVNPTLESGEIGYDETQKKFKMGDGSTRWNDLIFYETGGGSTYTEGKGIAIDQNDAISVKARASQFAFNASGEMYLITTGDDGFVTTKVMRETIDNVLGDINNVLITI